MRAALLLLDGVEIIDEYQCRDAVSLQPRVGGVPHDGQHPSARAFPWVKLPIPRYARRQASCTTSSESAGLPVSQRASV